MNFLAIDLGATSGRAIVYVTGDGDIKQREISRFDNPLITCRNHVYWDIYHLYDNILAALRKVANEGLELTSIGIDTWGVDFVLVGSDGNILRSPFAYRDPHTDGVPARYFAEAVPAERVYELTGTQVMNFNSLFQLYAMHLADDSALRAADKILFMPDALAYLLTGRMVTEYTIASTSNFLNPRTRRLEAELLTPCGVTPENFAPMVMPGTVIGTLTPEVQRLTGLADVPVVAVASHDTASAVAAVPAEDENYAYLSSGTWSLMGIVAKEPIITADSRAENFTNEGGVDGTTRFLKNICGMWLIEQCRAEWKRAGEALLDYDALAAAAEDANIGTIINPDAPSLANPASMTQAIAEECRKSGQQVPENQAEFARVIYRSLAARYAEVFRLLQHFAPFEIKRLHIIGGGSQNTYLNSLTEKAVGVPVIAGPVEATALGNLKMQIRAAEKEN